MRRERQSDIEIECVCRERERERERESKGEIECVCVERERADKKDQLFVHCLLLFNIMRVATVGGQDCFSSSDFLFIKFKDWRQ